MVGKEQASGNASSLEVTMPGSLAQNMGAPAAGSGKPGLPGARRRGWSLPGAKTFTGWASIIGGLLLWELLARYVAAKGAGQFVLIASPSQFASAIWNMAQRGQLSEHVVVSLYEFVIGFGLALLIGIIGGVATGFIGAVDRALSVWVTILYATPIVALAPLFIMWLGLGPASKIAVVAVMSMFPIWINTQAGIQGTDPVLLDVAKSFGATRLQTALKVSIPYALPVILAGLRVAVGRGLIGLVVGEQLGAVAGIGYLINRSAQTFNMPVLFGATALLAITGIIVTRFIRFLEERLTPWGRSE